MQVPLSAYADDCTLTGVLDLPADRLSDFLGSTDEFAVGNVTFRALDDGRTVELGSAAIGRDDLCVVLPTEPRGREDLRTWTRQYPVRVQAGPYLVLGYLHAPPTIDPLKMNRRRAILALTSGTVAFAQAGNAVRVDAETILVNSAKVELLEATSSDDIALGGSEDADSAR
jgi:hypothetical protein